MDAAEEQVTTGSLEPIGTHQGMPSCLNRPCLDGESIHTLQGANRATQRKLELQGDATVLPSTSAAKRLPLALYLRFFVLVALKGSPQLTTKVLCQIAVILQLSLLRAQVSLDAHYELFERLRHVAWSANQQQVLKTAEDFDSASSLTALSRKRDPGW